MEHNSRIFIAGSQGMVGSSLLDHLKNNRYQNLITASSKELDLRNQLEVEDFLYQTNPEYVFLAAAKVGGIFANNSYKAEFIYDNLQIQNNVIHYSFTTGVKKLLFLGSSCIYPKLSKLPISEDQLMTGELEHTNEAYAVAKIAGLKMCQFYKEQYGFNAISAMPTNLYGPNDNFSLENSHVLPALIKKALLAKKKKEDHLNCWGTGNPMREFLYVEDLAEALVFLMRKYDGFNHINIGTGKEISIKNLALKIMEIVDHQVDITWDISKPDGTFSKVLDVSLINKLGWCSKTSLEDGLLKTINWALEHNIIET